jgi:hypothetical protein
MYTSNSKNNLAQSLTHPITIQISPNPTSLPQPSNRIHHHLKPQMPTRLFQHVRPSTAGVLPKSSGWTIFRWSSTSTSPSKHHAPLRILFCGADAFSIYSLRALHELQQKRPDKIASIDVVCRPDKRVGRGLKKLQEGK